MNKPNPVDLAIEEFYNEIQHRWINRINIMIASNKKIKTYIKTKLKERINKLIQ